MESKDLEQKLREDLLIHYGDTSYSLEKFQKITDEGWVKPRGGLWTSPLKSEWGWRDWCNAENFRECKREDSFLLKLNEDSRIYIIDSVEDVRKAPVKTLGYMNRMTINFEILSQDYDALWLTRKGESETRWEEVYSLYGWDCESVLILNPHSVTQVEQIQVTGGSFPVYQYLH